MKPLKAILFPVGVGFGFTWLLSVTILGVLLRQDLLMTFRRASRPINWVTYKLGPEDLRQLFMPTSQS